MTLEESTKLIALRMDQFKIEAENALKGNKSAGKRARKLSMEITKLLKEFRGLSTGREQA